MITIYAKLINNQIHYAPRKLHIGNQWVWNPTPEMLMAEGYLPVIETDPPEAPDGYYYSPGWEEQGGQIVQEWELVEIPISDEEALTRYANELTGQNDPDLLSAAETMITKLARED